MRSLERTVTFRRRKVNTMMGLSPLQACDWTVSCSKRYLRSLFVIDVVTRENAATGPRQREETHC